VPCNTIIRQSIDFAAGKNNLMDVAKALEALGYKVTVGENSLKFQDRWWQQGEFADGKFNVWDDFNIDQVKQQFSRQVIRSTAKQYGWSVTEKADGKLEVRKRV
jgi:hypothetical protein